VNDVEGPGEQLHGFGDPAGKENHVKERSKKGLEGELPPLISVAQACELLGVGRASGYRAAATGDLPTIRWNRRLYVPTARLRAMVGLEGERAE
jgi:hypothetical protein